MRPMTQSDLQKAMRNLAKRYPALVVEAEYEGTGAVVPEPREEEPLDLNEWPTCDELLASWYGGEAADWSEGFTIINWEGR
jgi:hypothetical protein